MSPLPHVAILRWPEEAAVVAYLRHQGRPRLLLVAPDAAPPIASGWDEDWVRLPSSEQDVRARAEALEARSALRDGRPEVRADGRLFFNGRWVSLSPTEEAILALLAEHFGEVVDADTLADGNGALRLSSTAVRVHLTRLRKRIGPLGLIVRTVRGRGYVLDSRDEGARDTAALAGRHPAVPAPRPIPVTPQVAVMSAPAEGGASEPAQTEPAPEGSSRRARRPRRARVLSAQPVRQVGDLLIDPPQHRVTLSGRLLRFTPTELMLLAVLARRPGRLVTRESLLAEVWGQGAEETHCLRVYAARIRKKLGDSPSAPRLITEPGIGYRLVVPEPRNP